MDPKDILNAPLPPPKHPPTPTQKTLRTYTPSTHTASPNTPFPTLQTHNYTNPPPPPPPPPPYTAPPTHPSTPFPLPPFILSLFTFISFQFSYCRPPHYIPVTLFIPIVIHQCSYNTGIAYVTINDHNYL